MKKTITLCLCLIIISTLFSMLHAQVVCTIDNTTTYGSAPALANGAAYKNFTDAIAKLNVATISSPVTFNVAAGQSFTETAMLSLSKSGTSVNTITFRKSGSGSNPVIVPLAGTGNLDAIVRLLGVSYVTFDGIDLTENTASTTAIQKMEIGYYLVSSTSIANTHNSITNCKISLDRTNTNASYGVYQNGTGTGPSCSDNTFSHLTISNLFCGIYLNGKTTTGDDNATISDCIIGAASANDIGGNASVVITSGISCKYQNNLTISGCEVRNVTAVNTTNSSEANGISITANGGTSNVFNNKIHDISNKGTGTTIGMTCGIQLSSLSTGVLNVYNNMVSGLYTGDMVSPGGSASAVKLGGISIGIGSQGTANIYHNTVLLQNSTTNYLAGTACLNASSTASNTVNAVNNIFSNRYTPGAAGCYCISTNNTSSSAYTVFNTSNYNDFDIISGTNRYAGRYAGTNQATLASWRTATGKDANSRQFAANFVNTGTAADLHVNLGAPDSNYYGTPITTPAITTDIDGDSRSNTTPYIGADEQLMDVPVSVTWNLTAATPYAGTSTGGITALDMSLNNLIIRSDSVPLGPLGVRSQWVNPGTSTYWPYGASNPSFYYEFQAVAPSARPMTITHITLPAGAANTGNMRLDVQYSTDHFLTAPQALTTTPVVLSNGSYASPTPQFDTHIVVGAGDTLTMRVFPFLSSSSSNYGRYVYLQAVEISGTTGITPQPLPQLAFPGAEGAGKYVTGGRGTLSVPSTVFEVTTLLDTTTAGSIRYACTSAATYRTIVFRVSGTIHLKTNLVIPANTTVAGQTAPGDGICLADRTVNVGGNNVIVRNIRCRMGDKFQNKGNVVGGADDAFEAYKKSRIIIDHCTMSWSTDETFSAYGGDSITLQWNLVSEPLDSSYHIEDTTEGVQKHGLGAFWGGRHATFHHNLIAHCEGRFPRLSGSNNYSPAGEGAEKADLVNNVMYNWGPYSADGGAGGRYNIINNYYKYGPEANEGKKANVLRKYEIMSMATTTGYSYGRVYLTGNYMDGNTAITQNNWLGMAMAETTQADTILAKVSSPFPSMHPMVLESAQDAYASVLKGAGAIMPKRDTLDERIVNDVKNRTGRFIDVQGGYPHGTPYSMTVNAWPTLLSIPAATDGDHDGMPGAWEARRGLDSTNAADRNIYNANGYTNLENYLNGDSIVAMGKMNTCVTARPVYISSGGGWVDIKDTTYSYNISTDTMNLVASVANAGNYGLVNASYYVQSATRDLAGKPYLNRNVTIVPNAAPGSPVKMRLYFSKAEFDSLAAHDPYVTSLNDLRVLVVANNSCMTSMTATYTTITPSSAGSWGTYQNGYYLEFETTVFGTFFIAGDNSGSSMRLIAFDGQLTDNRSELMWVTESERTNRPFILERSADSIHFTRVVTIPATNTGKRTRYREADSYAFENKIFYRLKVVDAADNVQYSNIVTIEKTAKVRMRMFPNPSSGYLAITHEAAADKASLRVLSANGHLVLHTVPTVGSTFTELNIAHLAGGTYWVIWNNQGRLERLQLFKR